MVGNTAASGSGEADGPQSDGRPAAGGRLPLDHAPNGLDRSLLDFSEIDAATMEQAVRLWEIVAPLLPTAIDAFYRRLRASAIGGVVTDGNVERLKQSQKAHWSQLFTGNFDDAYAASVRRVGIRHRDLHVDPMWFVAAYTALKIEFVNIVLNSDISAVEKGRLIRTLDKFVAIDMGLALSAYVADIID